VKLVVGLGNPGPKYERTRHNIGFMAVDEITRRHSFRPPREKFSGAICEGDIGGERVTALKPLTYMNNSGESVAAAARFFKLEPQDVIVIHDELDLVDGKLRVKRGGGAAGHNGLRSIDAHLGPDYWRVRIGIGHPGRKDLVLHYVLQNFLPEETVWVEKLVPALAEAFPLLVAGQDSAFMSKVALLIDPPPPRDPSGRTPAPPPITRER
jgi:PTH1 family peptidyl-tRNA hydrolase